MIKRLIYCATLLLSANLYAETDAVSISGVQGGIIVHVGCDDPSAIAELRRNESYLVHALDTDAEKVAKARTFFSSQKLNGSVTATLFDGKTLPYIDNLVNLVIADSAAGIQRREILRVLAPYGVALIDGKKIMKPFPPEMDDWPQYLNKADNNAVSKDTLVGPPRHMQWVNGPIWSRSHMSIPTVNSMVTSHGRLFSIEDRATVENPFLPGRFALVARDAFNGVVLWSHPFAEWEPVTRYIKDITVQLQKRLVVVGDKVYCTPGIQEPVTEFDAGTGEILRVFNGTAETQEISVHDGMLYAITGDRMNAAVGARTENAKHYDMVKTGGKGLSTGGTETGEKARFDGTGFSAGYTPEYLNKETTRCDIRVIEIASGQEVWRESSIVNYIGGTLSLKDSAAVYMHGSEAAVKCLDTQDGSTQWETALPASKKAKNRFLDGTAPNVLTISGSRVYATNFGQFTTLSLKTGETGWSGSAPNNYFKTPDLFVVKGVAWTGGSGTPTSFDPETGMQEDKLKQLMNGPMGHDRCYRNFITETYYINSKTGGADFLNMKTGQEFPNHWLRGTCGMGTLPANSLLYAPPYSCQCSMGSMIKGFNALYTEPGLKTPDQMIEVARKTRLIKGPAYSTRPDASKAASAADWPVFRADNERSGSNGTELSEDLSEKWSFAFTGTASAPVIAADTVFIADVDAHSVYALDAASGTKKWQFIAGGRVDSPPTYHNGLLLFGSHDGWVYCLRADDGALRWKFKDLPEKYLSAFNQLESVWPVRGSVLVKDDTLYFGAGRSSFLDGGMFVYAMDPVRGTVKHSKQFYGPFDSKMGFPAVSGKTDDGDNNGFKNDILTVKDGVIYMRHKAFNSDLTPFKETKPHLLPSAGFLDPVPQHRTYWTVANTFVHTGNNGVDSDILATDGNLCFGVRGFQTHRHSYFDPRSKGYRLFCTDISGLTAPKAATTDNKSKKGKKAKKSKGSTGQKDLWETHIPLTGKAIVKAGNALCIAGTPMRFKTDTVDLFEKSYEGQLGGVIWIVHTEDGSKRAEVKLDAAPVWDTLAAANGRLFIALNDGTLRCFK